MQKTLEQLRLLFLEIAQAHEKIDSFYWGNFLQAQKGDSDNPITYPCLVVDVESANLDKSFVGIDLLITIADKVLKGHQNLNDTRSDTLQVIKHVVDTMNSPKWQSFSKTNVQGQAQWFLDGSVDEVSGWVIRVRLDIISQRNLCDMPMGNYDFDGTFISLCAPVKIFENGIFKESIEAGGSFFYNTGGVCLPANYVVEYESGTLIEEGTIESGGSKTIIVPDCPPPEPCADGTVNVQQSDATLISAVTVASGGTAPYLVADSVITLNDTTPTLISTTNVKATDNATIVAPDGVVTITDTTPTTLHTVNVKSNGIASQQISDSTVNVQKSDNTLIAAVSVKAQGTEPYQVADSIVNVNAVKLADVKATDTLSISVVDSTDTAVSVTLSGGNKITIPSLPCAAPSCVDTYNLVDFFTLDRNNPFGNTNRFTAPDGTQTYTNGVVLDWFTGRDYAETVFMFDVSILASNTHATQIAGEPYTVGGFNNFVVISQDHLYNLLNKGSVPPAEALNYAPFNHIVSTNPTRIRSRGDFYDNTTATWMYNATGQLLVLSKTTAVSSMLQRLTTFTELGL
jgi:VCBS repeat-containing protein